MSAPLEVRRLGAAALPATRIGLGMAALGRPGYINLGHGGDVRDRSVAGMRRQAHAVLDAALACGVGYFDAARSYGRAEEFLAAWLAGRGLAPGRVTVASKWGYAYTAGWRVDAEEHEVKDLSAAQLRRQLEETSSLLGRHLCLYQIHSATLESGVLEDAEVLAELASLRRGGLAVGLTVTGDEQAATVRRACELQSFDTVQATWNLLERSAGPALEQAHAAGMGVIVKEALANGRLAPRGGEQLLVETARRRGLPADALALAAVLARPWVDVVLSGASTVPMLEANLAALDVEWDGELEHALAGLEEEPGAYWRRRAELPWN